MLLIIGYHCKGGDGNDTLSAYEDISTIPYLVHYGQMGA